MFSDTPIRRLSESDFQWMHWPLDDPDVLALVKGIIATQDAVFARYGITRNMHVVHLMAQLSHESGCGRQMTESLNYTASALLKQWPHRFTPAQAEAYGRTDHHPADQKMIGALAYGGRMGNAPAPSPDGYNFRGRGFIQTTGRDAYRDLGKITGLDLVGCPELVNDPAHAFECAVAEFVQYYGILSFCEVDNLLAVSALINVGHLVRDPNQIVGYWQRAYKLGEWEHMFGYPYYWKHHWN